MDSKSAALSKTIIGILVALAVPLLAKHGISVDSDGLATDLLTVAAAGFAIYGRFNATQPLHIVTPDTATPPAPKQSGFARVWCLQLVCVAGLLVLAALPACSTTSGSSSPANTAATAAYDAQLVANLALAAVPSLESGKVITTAQATQIITAAQAVSAAAVAVQACVAASQSATAGAAATGTCATDALDAALATLTAITPAQAITQPAT